MTITFTDLAATNEYAGAGTARYQTHAFGMPTHAGGIGAGAFGRVRFKVRAVGVAYSKIVVADPAIPAMGAIGFQVRGEGVERSSHYEVCETHTRTRAIGHSGTGGVHRLKVYGVGRVQETGGFGLYAARPPELDSYGGYAFAVTDEAFKFGAVPSRLYAAVSRAPLKLGTRRSTRYDGQVLAAEQFSFADATWFVVHMLAADSISFGTLAVGEYRMLARAVSRLLLSGHATSYAEALQLIADALVFNDLAQWMQLADASDTLALNAHIDALYAAFARIVDQLVLNAQATPEFTLTVMLRDSFALGAQATHEAEFIAQLADAIGFAMSLSFDNGEFIAWVMNTESRGLSRYTNYPFNSFAKIGGKYYGAHAGGIARLGGRDDMGEPIKAKLRLGMFDFGDRHLKSFSDVFFGMAAGGQMLLKAVFVDEQTGEKNMAVYKVMPRPAGASRETRAKLGKGMKAVDWDFVLENVDGADFDLHSIQFYPTQLSRRTRG